MQYKVSPAAIDHGVPHLNQCKSKALGCRLRCSHHDRWQVYPFDVAHHVFECENKASLVCSSLPQTVEGGKLGEQHADDSHDGYEFCQGDMLCSTK